MRRVAGSAAPALLAWLLATAGAALAGGQDGDTGAGACRAWAAPVISLGFGSRYRADSKTRSEIDDESNAEVNAALRPVDDFIRAAASEANQILLQPGDGGRADCLIGALRSWADAGALGDMQTYTARLSVGGRFAGLALAYLQVRDRASRAGDIVAIDRWLRQAARAELRFWDEEATAGAKRGNLRAWSSLGVIATGIATDTPDLVTEAASVLEMLICTADPDGGLPQEMRRGKYALHYQLHAIAPMVVSVALLRSRDIDLRATCDAGLQRIVGFAVSDLDDGAAAQARTGVVQSYFDGTETLRPHELAWAELYLRLFGAAALEARVAPLRPLRNSKLGGNQSLLAPLLVSRP